MNSQSLARVSYNAVQSIARELYRAREEKGMCIKELSQLSGVSETMIRRIENANTNARIGTLAKLAHCLDLVLVASFKE